MSAQPSISPEYGGEIETVGGALTGHLLGVDYGPQQGSGYQDDKYFDELYKEPQSHDDRRRAARLTVPIHKIVGLMGEGMSSEEARNHLADLALGRDPRHTVELAPVIPLFPET